MDFLQEPITEFEMDICGISYTQRVVYENHPSTARAAVMWVTSSRSVMLQGISIILRGVVQGVSTSKPAQKSQPEEQEWRTVGHRTTGMLAKSFVERPPQTHHTYYQQTPEVSSATLGGGTRFDALEEGEIEVVESGESDDSDGSEASDESGASDADGEEDEDVSDGVGDSFVGSPPGQIVHIEEILVTSSDSITASSG
ncbi:hypothetical protein ACS0TY_022492 [Phlomoides rotata]